MWWYARTRWSLPALLAEAHRGADVVYADFRVKRQAAWKNFGSWFNGKVAIAPPVMDLTAQGFTLLGGRLDYVDGRSVASIVYRRRAHVINLFVAQEAASADRAAKFDTMQGFNIRRWRAQGLEFFAVSDISADELQEFVDKFDAAFHSAGGA